MTPVDMQQHHDPASGCYGDCMRACIASILNLPHWSVPHFMQGDDTVECYKALQDWLEKRGLYYVAIRVPVPYPEGLIDIYVRGHHVMIGKGRPETHAVVGYRGKVVHDPDPKRLFANGLDELLDGGIEFGFLCRL